MFNPPEVTQDLGVHFFRVTDSRGLGVTRKALGEYLAQAREALDMTQVELAEKVEVTPGQVSKWERGLALPSPRKLAKVAGVLRLDLGEFAERYAAASQEEVVSGRRELSDVRRDLEFALGEVTRFTDTYAEFHAEYQRIGERVDQLAEDVDELKQAVLRLEGLVLRALGQSD